MTVLHLAPTVERPERGLFVSPTGSCYLLRFPSMELAEEMRGLGIRRLVIPEEVDIDNRVALLLFDEGIEIVTYSSQ